MRIHRRAGCGDPPFGVAISADGGFAVVLQVANDSRTELFAAGQTTGGVALPCTDAPLVYVEDSTAPPAPFLAGSEPPSPGNTTAPSLVGSAEPWAAVQAFVPDCDGGLVGTGIADGDGGFALIAAVPAATAVSIRARAVDRAGNASICSSGAVDYTHDGIPPDTDSAVVIDGAMEDIDAQRVNDSVDAAWSGFVDNDVIALFEHALSTTTDCLGDAVAPTVTTLEAITLSGLSLAEGAYYNCVRAIDRAANASAWVASDGFVVDFTPPVLVARVPDSGAVDGEPRQPVTLTFSEPVATMGSLTLTTRSQAVAGTVSVDGATVRFTPDNPLRMLEPYEVFLAAGVQDGTGNATQASERWSFTVRDGQWGAPIQFATGSEPVAITNVAINERGDAVIAWQQPDEGNAAVFGLVYSREGGPGMPRLMTPAPTWASIRPVVAINDEGVAFVVWNEYLGDATGDAAGVHAARYAPDGGWGAPMRISANDTRRVHTADVAVDAAGYALVMWLSYPSVSVYTRWFDPGDGKGWEVVETKHSGSETVGGFWGRVELSPAGDGVVAWLRQDVLEVRASSISNRNIAPPVTVAPGVQFLTGLTSSISGSGRMALLWRQTNVLILHRAERTGDTWAAAPLLPDEKTITACVSVRDARVIVGTVSDRATDAMWHSVDFGTPALAEQGAVENAANARCGADETGHGTVLWTSPVPDAGATRVMSRRYHNGGGWQDPSEVMARESIGAISYGMAAGGHAMLVWVTGGELWLAVFD